MNFKNKKKVNKNQNDSNLKYVKKSSFIIQPDGSFIRRRNKKNYEDIILEKQNYISIIKNLSEKEFKNIKISEKEKSEKKKEKDKKLNKSNSVKKINILNEEIEKAKKKFNKSNSMKNIKTPKKKTKNIMYLTDKKGEFYIQFIDNENKNPNLNNYIIINNDTSLEELKDIKQKLENIISNKKKEIEKEKLNKNNNLFKDINELQFNLRNKKHSIFTISKLNINNQENTIICKPNNFDYFNFEYLNKKTKTNKSHSISYKNNIDLIKSFSNSYNNSFLNYDSNKNKNYFKSKSNLDLLSYNHKNTFKTNFITDEYCNKMVKMNILSKSSSNHIQNLNKSNIYPNNFYFNQMLIDRENYLNKNKKNK